jgi:predicted transcriptional regulator
MLTENEAIAAHIAEGFAQAERGELIDPEEAVRILRDRQTKRAAKRLPEEPKAPERIGR